MDGKWTLLALLALGAGCVRVEKPALLASHPPAPAVPSPPVAASEPAPPPAAADPEPRITFAGQIQPILARCTPCHFPGGKMYAKLPFDRAETVRLLGERLFTRIHDESERQLIRAFLAQESGASP
jgi:hypothetical protein